MKKMRVRITAGLLVALATALVVGTGSAAAAPSAAPAPVKITVTATEFAFKFSKASISKPGTVIFTVINKGTIAHNFSIQALHKTTKMLQPKQKTTLTVKFTKKGSFYYLCTVPRHAEEGMAGSFKVK
jgi:plastocyanin